MTVRSTNLCAPQGFILRTGGAVRDIGGRRGVESKGYEKIINCIC